MLDNFIPFFIAFQELSRRQNVDRQSMNCPHIRGSLRRILLLWGSLWQRHHEMGASRPMLQGENQ